MVCRIVLDTNVFISACLGGKLAADVLRACLLNKCQPLMGQALFAEYEDVLKRDSWAGNSVLNPAERAELFDVFIASCHWTRIYFVWRPNLPDEADNHLIELAVAGGASFVVTRNLRDLKTGELDFPGLSVVDPLAFLKELASWER